MKVSGYIAALEEFFNLTNTLIVDGKIDSKTAVRLVELQTDIAAYQLQNITITRVLVYKGNKYLIERHLKERAVQGIKVLPMYTIEEQFMGE